MSLRYIWNVLGVSLLLDFCFGTAHLELPFMFLACGFYLSTAEQDHGHVVDK